MLIAFLTRLKATFCLTISIHIAKKKDICPRININQTPWEEHLNLEKPVK
jgi:hypothetical protein